MARLLFTEEDKRLIESLLQEFDPAERLKDLPARDRVTAEQWDAFLETQRHEMRRYMRAALTIAPLGFGSDSGWDAVVTLLDKWGDERVESGLGLPESDWELERETDQQAYTLRVFHVNRILDGDFQPVS